MLALGQTGTGKSTLLETLVTADMAAGEGVALLDPHGQLAQRVLCRVPSWRTNKTIAFVPWDRDWPIGLNVLDKVAPSMRPLVVSGLVAVFKKLWPEFWGPRLEHVLRNALAALVEVEGTTLLSLVRLLADEDYRYRIVAKVKDPVIRFFWEQEFPRYSKNLQADATSPVQNKIGAFLASPFVRHIVGQQRTAFSFREVMDEGYALIADLSKGRIGEEASRLLGALLLTKLELSALARADVPESRRRDFYLYVDEFPSFATESFASLLSEARKYRLNLILANQHLAQLDERLRAAVLGNVGTLVAFRLGAQDAEALKEEFYPPFTPEDLGSLRTGRVILKLLIEGQPSSAFTARILMPPAVPEEGERRRRTVLEVTRQRYAKERVHVERASRSQLPLCGPA